MTSILVVSSMVCVVNAQDKYENLTAEYLETVSVEVKRIMASDPKTSKKTLDILFRDADLKVRGNVVANPSY